ncbi:uncharacterized protein C5L36_0E01520 [Pichia kudriavzevii]|uniref:Protein YIP n=1 Tax=Pichia kudriavzevii TaxID=4909 RepID=A0A099P4Q9_PICKU|nr:uncharacterized protein C5L36_0E01520 [Pichia kudriavzevii]AWU78089.1 hypothetical protein C5L36_0E01520 [Pichia kudriavzevii]KGK39998.1 hypothetical protein JL09_g832 [Pichia kudriavzevii]
MSKSNLFADNDIDGFQIDDNLNDDTLISPDNNPANLMASPEVPQSLHINNTPQFKKKYEGGIFSLNYYRQYFDLNTSEFISNCLSSLNPLSKPSADDFNHIGDVYGSIWITATLVFLLFFCNSFAALLSGWFLNIDLKSMKINYFKMIISSINLLYGYSVVIPLILYLILKFYLKVLFLVPLSKLVSIYSYANLMWIPAALLSIFRGFLVNHSILDTVLKWICITIGALMSGASILHKLKIYFSSIFGEEEKKMMYALLALLFLAHVGFAIGLKVCFFGKL